MNSILTLLTALPLAPLAALQASYLKTLRVVIAPFSTTAQSQPKLTP